MKLGKKYSDFMKSQRVSNFIDHIEKEVVGPDNSLCMRSLEFLKAAHGGAGFLVFNRLQARFFDVLDKLAELGPEESRDKTFSFRNKSTPLHDLESKLIECFGVYSLGTFKILTGLLTFWAAVVKSLSRAATGYGAGCPSEYKETDRFIYWYLTAFHGLVYGIGPNFPDKGHIDVDLDNILSDAFVLFSGKKTEYDPVPSIGFYLRIGPEGSSMFILPEANRFEWLIMRLSQIDFCFDVILNKVLPASWDDLRSGGCHLVGRQYESVKPIVDLFSLFPVNVSRDEKLFKTLFSLKNIMSSRLSSDFKAILDKNDNLLLKAKKLNSSKCPDEIGKFIERHLLLCKIIYKKWSKNKIKFQCIDEESLKRKEFLKLFQDVGFPGGDRGKCLFGENGIFSDDVVDGLIDVIHQERFGKSRERAVVKILKVFLYERFHKNFAETTVKKWMVEIQEQKDRRGLATDLNL